MQPGHPVVRPYLSRMLWRMYNFFTRRPLANSWLNRWSLRRALGCRIPKAANTPTHELRVPSAIALKTSHTTRHYCSCWRQQEEFIGAIKLADKNSSHPSHIQFSPIFRIFSSQADLSEWHNFFTAIRASNTAIWRCPRSFHLKMMHDPCTVPNHPTHLAHVQVQFLFCISMTRLPEMRAAVPELSNLLAPHASSSLSSLFGVAVTTRFVDWHRLTRTFATSKSTWLLVTFQLCLADTQPVNVILNTLYHTIAEIGPCNESVATIIEIFLLGSPRVSVANAYHACSRKSLPK